MDARGGLLSTKGARDYSTAKIARLDDAFSEVFEREASR